MSLVQAVSLFFYIIISTLKKKNFFYQSEAERLRKVRETTEEEMSRLRLAEEELVQVKNVLYIFVSKDFSAS